MKWRRDEYVDLMTHNHPPREMLVELFGPLVGLEREWAAQGATPGQLDLSAFCFDWVDTHHIGGSGAMHGQPEVILEETDAYVIKRDHLGRTTKLFKHSATIPLPLDFPVKDMDSWRRIKHLFEDAPERTNQEWLDGILAAQARGALMISSIPGAIGILRDLMGEETMCLAFYDQPELVKDILGTISRTNERVIRETLRHVQVDQLSLSEDLAGRHAPLIGPATIKEFIEPYYLASWNILKESGTKLFAQDSDGNLNAVVDAFIEAGVNIFYPCEPAADMDIVALRKKYGKKIAMKGGIDKHVLRQNKAAIRRELEYKLQPSMLGGGMVFGLDHRIPNGTPLENYIFYVDTARELLGLPPVAASEPGWARMAF